MRYKYWEDRYGRHELFLGSRTGCVLYYSDDCGYYVRIYIGGGSREKLLSTKDLTEAKKKAEEWLAEKINEQISTYENSIAEYKDLLVTLALPNGGYSHR